MGTGTGNKRWKQPNNTGKLLGKGRNEQMKRIFLIAVIALAALFMAGCDLFVDRSATELAFEDVQEIDVEDLQKYENLQSLDIRSADVGTELYDQLHAALPKLPDSLEACRSARAASTIR